MSFFTDLMNVVKENPIAAATCAAAGAVVVGATWAIKSACSGDKKQEAKPAPAQPATSQAAQAAETAAKATAEAAAQAATQATADATKA